MKPKIAIGLALVAGLWIVASIQQLKFDVNDSLFGVKAKLDRVETELSHAKSEMSSLRSVNGFMMEEIAALKKAEWKRTVVACKTFPNMKGCDELWKTLSGDDLSKSN
jgi:hypothetical protein